MNEVTKEQASRARFEAAFKNKIKHYIIANGGLPNIAKIDTEMFKRDPKQEGGYADRDVDFTYIGWRLSEEHADPSID